MRELPNAACESGIPLELIGLLTPLPADGEPVPGEIVEHQAHAIGHAAVLLADRGVLLAGDMLSDVLIPRPSPPDQVATDHAYIDALRRGEEPVDARLSQDWLSGPHQSNQLGLSGEDLAVGAAGVETPGPDLDEVLASLPISTRVG